VPAGRRVLVFLALVALAAAIYVVTRSRRDLVDFEVYRTAAQRVVTAQPLYRPEDGHWQFKYLPVFALVVSPFGRGNPEIVKAVWFAFSCGLVALLFTRSVDLLPDRRRTEAGLIALAALVTAKLWIKELVEGQTNLWLAALVLGAVAAANRRRPVLAGLLVGAAVFVKPYALIFVPWLLVACGVTSVAACLATVAVGLAAPAFVYGWSGNIALHVAWWQGVTSTTGPNLLFPENMSVASMWAKWIGAGAAASTLAIATGGTLLALALTMFRRRSTVSGPSLLEVAALLILVPLLSPQGWDYVALLGIPATIAVLDRWRDVGVVWRILAGTAIVVTGFTIYDLLGRATYLRAMSCSVLTLAAMTLLVCVVHLRWRRLA
jgi:hypothetical protein